MAGAKIDLARDFRDLLHAFIDHEVRFLVVGAYALAVHGRPRATGDLDLWVDPTAANAEHAFAALQRFGVPLRDLTPADLATPGVVYQIGLAPLRIDVLTRISGVEFADAWPRRVQARFEDVVVPVLGREDLLANRARPAGSRIWRTSSGWSACRSPRRADLRSRTAYPVEEVRDAVLRDGRRISVRPTRTGDAQALQDLFFRLRVEDVQWRSPRWSASRNRSACRHQRLLPRPGHWPGGRGLQGGPRVARGRPRHAPASAHGGVRKGSRRSGIALRTVPTYAEVRSSPPAAYEMGGLAMTGRAALLALALILLLPHPVRAFQGFFELGELEVPGQLNFWSRAHDVSADGQVVVGDAISGFQYSSSEQAFRWEAGVMHGLADLVPQHERSLGFGVSRDGQVVVGTVYTQFGGPFGFGGGFVWDENDVVTPVGELPGGGTWSSVYGTNADGSVVVGYSEDAITDRAIRWDAGTLTTLGTGLGWSYANAVDPSGSTVVGYQSNGIEDIAVRWDGLVGSPLPDPPQGDFGGEAFGISADGSVIVGRSLQSAGEQAIRWDASGASLLGMLPGHTESQALDTSGDGAIVVGYSCCSPAQEAVIWDAVNGTQRLQDVLVDDFGFDLTGWTLQLAEGISDDGMVIVGTGINPDGRLRGWIANLAGNGAPACSDAIDNDGDGQADYPSDPGCFSALDEDELSHTAQCDDGADNDGDGDVDHPADAACESLAGSQEGFQCDDGRDNDADGKVDWDGRAGGTPDPGCGGDPHGQFEQLEQFLSCGLGFELVILLAPLLALRRWRTR